jgi:Trypsin
VRKFRSIVVIFSSVLVSLPISPGLQNANAITYGKEFTNSTLESPWTLPIFIYERSGTSPSALCTGTLIKPDVVLTAAHCVPDEGFFEVKYGITSLNETSKSYLVDGAWRHPRYSQNKLGVNDIGLLKLKEPIIGAAVLPIASSKLTIKAESSPNLKIYGWGEDQNGVIATYLRGSSVKNQTAAIAKRYGKLFNKNTWLAAGSYISKERVYSGGCHGDSGGPLVATVNGSSVQIGVTSFGADICDVSQPTIFMKLSYYINDINQAIKQLSLNSVVTDRSPPENISSPSVGGAVRIGQLLTCNPGEWSKNVSQIKYEWFTSDNYSISTSQKLLIGDELAGKLLKCAVTGSNRTGDLTKTVDVQVPQKSTVLSPATITGMPATAYSILPNNQVSCNPAGVNGQIESSSFTWWLRSNSNDLNGINLGNAQTQNFPSSWFQENAGKLITCVYVASGPGGTVRSQADVNIFAPAKITISSVTITGMPDGYGGTNIEWIGTSAVCNSFNNAPPGISTNTSYTWRVYDSTPPYYPTGATPSRIISTGQSLLLTEAVLKDAVLKFIGCSAKIETVAGVSEGFSNAKYVDFKNIAVADKTAPSFSYMSILPFNGPTFRLRDPFTLVFTAGDSSGLGTYPFSFRAICNGATEVPLTINGSLYTYPGGTSASTKYEQSFILPSQASGGLLGSYQILIRVTDSKGNSTSWISAASFEVVGERTN